MPDRKGVSSGFDMQSAWGPHEPLAWGRSPFEQKSSKSKLAKKSVNEGSASVNARPTGKGCAGTGYLHLGLHEANL